MQKRSETVKEEKTFFRTKLKHTALVMLCIMFALSTLYAVDISTYKLMKNDKDEYAVRIARQSENLVRVDFVGKRYNVDIQKFRAYMSKVTEMTQSLVKDIRNRIQ